jgi:hypothetical protein
MKLQKLVAVVGVVASLAASGYAWAVYQYTEYEYYSDASMTVWVGTRINECNGKVYRYGVTTTPYRQLIDSYTCGGQIPR